MKKYLTVLMLGLSASTAHAFTAMPFPNVSNQVIALECSIVGELPLRRDPDPVYKIGVDIRTDANGNLETYNIVHTVRSGQEYDRSTQYSNGGIWKTPNTLEWYWKGYRGRATMIGLLTWNTKDGWMYSETIFDGYNRQDFRMLADCHDRKGD